MIDNPETNQCEIQADNLAPFVPDRIIQIGLEYDIYDTDGGIIIERMKDPPIRCAILHYILGGVEYRQVYKTGKWTKGTNDMPRFCAYGQISSEVVRA